MSREEAIKKIIQFTAWIDEDGIVEGHDTRLGHIDDLVEQGLVLLRAEEDEEIERLKEALKVIAAGACATHPCEAVKGIAQQALKPK